MNPFLKVDFIPRLLFLILPVVLLIFHSVLTLPIKRAILFILLASLTGLVMEIYGLTKGTFFGGYYLYRLDGLKIGGVPWSVVLYWAVFIYLGYSITNSFLFWLGKTKPVIKKNNFLYLLTLVLLDGWLVVAIDLFMDPLQVKAGNWIWLTKGPYFGIPIGNFVGWFLIAIFVSGIFRGFEYFFPTKSHFHNKSILLIPVLEYGGLAVSFLLSALKQQMINLAIIGMLVMFPTVLLNLGLYTKWRSKKVKLSAGIQGKKQTGQ